jgi:hypothetical protein
MATDLPPGVLTTLQDATHEASSALAQLREVTELLESEEYLRALGAFEGLEDRLHYVSTVLSRFARAIGLSK